MMNIGIIQSASSGVAPPAFPTNLVGAFHLDDYTDTEGTFSNLTPFVHAAFTPAAFAASLIGNGVTNPCSGGGKRATWVNGLPTNGFWYNAGIGYYNSSYSIWAKVVQPAGLYNVNAGLMSHYQSYAETFAGIWFDINDGLIYMSDFDVQCGVHSGGIEWDLGAWSYGTWYNIVRTVEYNDSTQDYTQNVYINNTQIVTDYVKNLFDYLSIYTPDFLIDSLPFTGSNADNNYWNVDSLLIFDKILDATDVSALYNGGAGRYS